MRGIILIVDDSSFNGELLISLLEDTYDVEYIDNGDDAIKYLASHIDELYMLFLDIVMPTTDGFDILSMMNHNGWINKVPVVIISSEMSAAYINHAYDLGAIDYLGKPFEKDAIFRRIHAANDKFMHAHSENKKEEIEMIEVLSNLVEFRNGETGLHLLHIKVITKILLERYRYLDKNSIMDSDFINTVSNAAALHDLGKIAVPYEILNKPGRLTIEEFEAVKKHSIYGAEMIRKSPNYETSKVLQIAYEIARWHHEKYDGRGYPDGLVGEQIPIYVQAVSIADCYDALTSERCYKKAYPPSVALDMIVHGECGIFSPIMLQCLDDSKEELIALLDVRSPIALDKAIQNYMIGSDVAGGNSYFTNKLRLQFNLDRIRNKYLYHGENECVFDINGERYLTFARFNFTPITNAPSQTILDSIKSQILSQIDNSEKDIKVDKKINVNIYGIDYEYNLHYALFVDDNKQYVIGRIYR